VSTVFPRFPFSHLRAGALYEHRFSSLLDMYMSHFLGCMVLMSTYPPPPPSPYRMHFPSVSFPTISLFPKHRMLGILGTVSMSGYNGVVSPFLVQLFPIAGGRCGPERGHNRSVRGESLFTWFCLGYLLSFARRCDAMASTSLRGVPAVDFVPRPAATRPAPPSE